MADTVQEIVLKLTIDNKEYQAKIDVTKGSLVELVKLIDPMEQKFENTYKKITAELSKYNQANEQSVKELTEWIRTQDISLEMIEQTITKLQTETKALDINSEHWQKSMAAVENMRAAHAKVVTSYDQSDKAHRQMTTGISSMNMAIGQFGFLLGDADMFLMNFRMGMMSVANNFPMVIQFMQYAREEATKMNKSMGQAFFESIKGPGGLLLGVNAAMFAMNILARVFEGTTETVKDQQEEIKKLRAEYEKLTREQLQNKLISEGQKLRELEQKYPVTEVPGMARSQFGGQLSTSRKLTDSERFGEDLTNYQAVQQNLKAIKETLFTLGDIENIENRISINRQRLRDLNKENLTLYQDVGTTYDEIKNKLNEWIAADEKLADESRKNSTIINEQKKFSESLAKTSADLFKDELIRQAGMEIAGKDYFALLTDYETAQDDYNTHLQSFHQLKNQTELDGWNFVKDVMEKNLEQMKKKLDEDEKAREDAENKALANRKKRAEEQDKWEQEKQKFEREASFRFETDPYQQQLKELEAEEAVSIQRAELYAATEEQITNIKAYYARQREMIEQQSMFYQITQVSQMLGQLASVFGKHTAAYKVLATAQVWIETYKGIAALYAPPPVGVGPVLAPFMTGALLGMGALQSANIMKQNTDIKGFATGGILPEGKAGFFEGTHKEIIAPEKDFISVVNDLVARSQIAIAGGFSGSSASTSSAPLINKIDELNDNIKKLAERPARAFLDNDEAMKIGDHYDYETRRSIG